MEPTHLKYIFDSAAVHKSCSSNVTHVPGWPRLLFHRTWTVPVAWAAWPASPSSPPPAQCRPGSISKPTLMQRTCTQGYVKILKMWHKFAHCICIACYFLCIHTCMYVYWSRSDTYLVFRTRFSPNAYMYNVVRSLTQLKPIQPMASDSMSATMAG